MPEDSSFSARRRHSLPAIIAPLRVQQDSPTPSPTYLSPRRLSSPSIILDSPPLPTLPEDAEMTPLLYMSSPPTVPQRVEPGPRGRRPAPRSPSPPPPTLLPRRRRLLSNRQTPLASPLLSVIDEDSDTVTKEQDRVEDARSDEENCNRSRY